MHPLLQVRGLRVRQFSMSFLRDKSQQRRGSELTFGFRYEEPDKKEHGKTKTAEQEVRSAYQTLVSKCWGRIKLLLSWYLPISSTPAEGNEHDGDGPGNDEVE